jgi:hypothetical protein
LVTGTAVEVDGAANEVFRVIFDPKVAQQICYYNSDQKIWEVSMFANDDRGGYGDNSGTIKVRILVFYPTNA